MLPRLQLLRGEFAGGLASAIPGLAHALTLGLLAFAPLGPEHADVGIRAGFAAGIFGGLAAAVRSGTPLPATGARASTSLILAGFVATLAADPALGAAGVFGLAILCVALSGVFQVLFGVLRLGSLAKFVPYPVLGGFMTGVAILIALSQVPHVLGLAPGALRKPALEWLATSQPLTAWVALATAAIIFACARYWKRAPAALVGLAAGTAVYYATRFVVPDGALGSVVGAIQGSLPLPTAFAGIVDLVARPAAARHLPALGAAAGVIAIIGSLDSLLAAAAIDAVAGTRHRANRELIAQGLGNIVSAAFGGAPVALSPTRAIPAWRAGGRTRAIGYVAAGLLATVLLAGTTALAYLPLAVLGGIMLTVAWGLVDGWTRGIVRRLVAGERDQLLLWSAAVVVLVAAITVFVNFVVAVITGLFLSMALFIATMSRSLVRAVHDGTARTSRRIYGPEDAQRLVAERRRIKLAELEGAIFFGSAERLVTEAERWADTADYIVLDLRRVTAIDATGALGLEQLARRLRGRKVNLALAGVTAEGRHGLALAAYGTFADPATRHWFADADQAIEWAERRLLGSIDSFSREEIPLERLAFAADLDGREIEALRQALRRKELDPGETLFREGEPGDHLYLLARGAISISIGGTDRASRIVTFAPGSIFGEAAMLDGGLRSATAVVAEDAVVYSLSRAALDRLALAHPALANKLLLNLGRHLSGRLRQTTDALRELSDGTG